MSLTMKDEGGSFTPCPAGNHVAICYAVIDLGTQHSDAFNWEGKSIPASDRPQILIMWEIPGELVDIDGEQKPAMVSKFYNAFFNDKAALRLHLEAWRGRQFTEGELCGFNISAVLGKSCMINVVHNDKGKAKIAGIAAMPKGMGSPEQTNESIHFDFDNYDQAVFDSLSEGIQNIIKKSPQYAAINAQPRHDHAQNEEPVNDFADDEIPF